MPPPPSAGMALAAVNSPHDEDFAIFELNDHIRSHVLLAGASNCSCRALGVQALSENFVSFQ